MYFERCTENVQEMQGANFQEVGGHSLQSVSHIGSDDDSDEQLFDICRAYGLLLNASGVLQTPVHEELAQEVS